MAQRELYRVLRAARALVAELDRLDEAEAARLDVEIDDLRERIEIMGERVRAVAEAR